MSWLLPALLAPFSLYQFDPFAKLELICSISDKFPMIFSKKIAPSRRISALFCITLAYFFALIYINLLNRIYIVNVPDSNSVVHHLLVDFG